MRNCGVLRTSGEADLTIYTSLVDYWRLYYNVHIQCTLELHNARF